VGGCARGCLGESLLVGACNFFTGIGHFLAYSQGVRNIILDSAVDRLLPMERNCMCEYFHTFRITKWVSALHTRLHVFRAAGRCCSALHGMAMPRCRV